MNKKNLSLKVDKYTIYLHREQEESEEMKQKRMALYATWLTNVTRKQMVKYFEEYCKKNLNHLSANLVKNAVTSFDNAINELDAIVKKYKKQKKEIQEKYLEELKMWKRRLHK